MYFKLIILKFVLLLVTQTLCYGQVLFKIGAEQVPPFEYQEDGIPKGIDVEMVKIIFDKLEVPYVIEFGNENVRSLEKAKKGDLDAILSVSFRQNRTEYLVYPPRFENPDNPQNFMWMSEYVFYATKETISAYSISSLTDIKKANLTVGVIEGVSYSPSFWDAKLSVKKGASDEENFKRLLSGEIDIYLTDKLIGRYTIKKLGVKNSVDHYPFKLIQKPYTLAFVKKSNHPKLVNLVENFYKELDMLKKSGVAKQIFLKELY